jgi:hypothetical protein
MIVTIKEPENPISKIEIQPETDRHFDISGSGRDLK